MFFDGNEELWTGIFAMMYKHFSWNRGILGEDFLRYRPAFIPKDTEQAIKMYDYEDDELKGFLNIGTVQALIKLLARSGAVFEDDLRKIIMSSVYFLSVFYSQKFGAHLDGNDELEKEQSVLVSQLDSFNVVLNWLVRQSLSGSKIIEFLIIRYKDPLLYQRDFDPDSQAFTNYQIIEKMTDTFFSGLRDIALEKCYVASFTNNCLDDRMWHDYTDYKGIALEYKSDNSLELQDSKGNKYSHSFRKVEYTEPQGFNFFNSIGKLSIPEIETIFPKYDWKLDPFKVLKGLRDRFFKWSEKTVLTKGKSWSTQNEFRLIISDFLNGYGSVSSRTFFYKFSELKSITFGPQTSAKNQMKILGILKNKCSENDIKEFPVYIVVRDDKTGLMTRNQLMVIGSTK